MNFSKKNCVVRLNFVSSDWILCRPTEFCVVRLNFVSSDWIFCRPTEFCIFWPNFLSSSQKWSTSNLCRPITTVHVLCKHPFKGKNASLTLGLFPLWHFMHFIWLLKNSVNKFHISPNIPESEYPPSPEKAKSWSSPSPKFKGPTKIWPTVHSLYVPCSWRQQEQTGRRWRSPCNCRTSSLKLT
jgi:hypothetical protein